MIYKTLCIFHFNLSYFYQKNSKKVEKIEEQKKNVVREGV